jgi:parvulin-like peptidyl-prolyl isomerase
MAEVQPPSYEDITSYFEANRQAFHQPEMVRFRQIVTQTREEAEALHKRLVSGENMAALAREFSTGPEAENGGEVGWIARGELHESMEGPLFSTEEGKITKVVHTPYGYHIFEVLAHRPEEIRELPEVYGRIEFELLSKKRDAYLDRWLQGLRSRFRVSVDRDKLSDMGTVFNEN